MDDIFPGNCLFIICCLPVCGWINDTIWLPSLTTTTSNTGEGLFNLFFPNCHFPVLQQFYSGWFLTIKLDLYNFQKILPIFFHLWLWEEVVSLYKRIKFHMLIKTYLKVFGVMKFGTIWVHSYTSEWYCYRNNYITRLIQNITSNS